MTETNTSQSATAVDEEVAEKGNSFLHLPAEIRNKIYRYSLVNRPRAAGIRSLVQPPLTRVNRQIRSESLPIYYGNNRFQITIPPRPPMHEHDGWADFIRMFRVFKAGRSAGPGTGSLQFLRNVSCIQNCGVSRESFWKLEAVFLDPSGPGRRKNLHCTEWDSHFTHTPKKVVNMTKRNHVYRCIAKAVGVDYVMNETCLHRLVSTVVMVATECPGVVEEVHFHANWRDEEEELGSEFW